MSSPSCDASASGALEAARAFRRAGRDDLAQGEEAEEELIKGYCRPGFPMPICREIVKQALTDSGAGS